MVPITYGGSTKEGKVSFSTGIDTCLRADLVISIVIVEGDGGDVIPIACGGKEHGMQTDMNARTLTKLNKKEKLAKERKKLCPTTPFLSLTMPARTRYSLQ